jgi:hypothetical protein
MSYNLAKRKKSNLTPQELLCVLFLLLEEEPGHCLVFKAIELADLMTQGSLKVKCEYFDSEKVYRISIKEDHFHGRELSVPTSGGLVLSYLKRLQQEKQLSTQEFITCLYMAVLRRPNRQFCFRLKSLNDLKKKGRMRMDCQYYGAEQTFILSAVSDTAGRIITPGNAVLTAMSGEKNGET